MNRSNPEDEAFKRRVTEEFTRARDRALKRGFTLEKFVESLGVTRAGFHKYVTGKAIPSLRVLARARKYWGVRLSYAELGDDYIKTKRQDPKQMKFQFSVADVSKDQIEVTKFTPKGERGVELVIKILFPKTA